ncbi:hypothetical protein AAFF_G00140910 [Aldrovandia affinis]|uniref:Uncharacterized protein n=1 Tax=Aldrovandia affinis TaxID=143900 RepID=A0AAD7TCF2_9TELE|nr:hypothetical protein AAFF_G00140910 [Aldrovandia affinis]
MALKVRRAQFPIRPPATPARASLSSSSVSQRFLRSPVNASFFFAKVEQREPGGELAAIHTLNVIPYFFLRDFGDGETDGRDGEMAGVLAHSSAASPFPQGCRAGSSGMRNQGLLEDGVETEDWIGRYRAVCVLEGEWGGRLDWAL